MSTAENYQLLLVLFLIGLGFMVEVAVPKFLFVLLAQIIWGVGYTFVNGAREAWITEEIGEEEANNSEFATYRKNSKLKVGSPQHFHKSEVQEKRSFVSPH